MDLICYIKGDSPEKRSLIEAYCDKHGISPMLIITDAADEFAGFRHLQNLIKLNRCDAVLVDSAASLGDDKYLRLENELFMKRNSVRLMYACKTPRDVRHDIAVDIKRYYGYLPTEDIEYGLEMPMPKNPEEFKRKPPYGYFIREGRAYIRRSSAEIVLKIFDSYISGKSITEICADVNAMLPKCRRFSTMTLTTILTNRRYLGILSDKGYHLPPIITYDKWLKARERFEKEHTLDEYGATYLENVRSNGRIVFFRDGRPCGMRYKNAAEVDAELLEREVEAAVSALASKSNAELIRSYSDSELDSAGIAYEEASAKHRNLLRVFKRDISMICEGNISRKVQERIEKRTDAKNFSAMRLRRIESEIEVFSSAREHCFEFFERASKISKLSSEEKRFLCNAFFYAIRIDGKDAFAYLKMPSDGSVKRLRLSTDIVK